MDLSKLSLEEKIGQKFMFGVTSSNIDIILDLIRNYHIGGVILYKKNYSNYEEMISVIKRLKDANKDNKLPLFISIDQEGGRVNRMPCEITNLKNIYDISKKDNKLISNYAKIIGKMLTSVGVNMNFAPVLDVCENNDSKILYNRCFYGNEENVYDCGLRYVKGLCKNDVIPVVKHFPGHGVSLLDSHFFVPYIFDKRKILDKHIKPFEKLMCNGIDALMVGHLVIREITKGLPASISCEFIQKFLREKYKYDGLVITDEINMLFRNPFYRFLCMKNIFKSGSDIILVKLRDNSKINCIDKYISFVKNNDKYLSMIDDNVRRIIKTKKKFNVNDDIKKLELDIDLINEEINKINGCC